MAYRLQAILWSIGKGRLPTIRNLGHEVKIERADKVLFPESGITKGEMIEYYRTVAPRMLPYLRGRPLAAQRFPDGIAGPGFFQKSVPRHYPDWIESVQLSKKGGTIRHVVCNDLSTLTYLANQACVTLHTWLSQADNPEVPQECIVDIDPSEDDVSSAVRAALEFKDLLVELGISAFVKTTGASGLHVHVPLIRDAGNDAARSFAKELAGLLVTKAPNRYTLEVPKRKREGKVYLDVNRNAYAQTAVAPYSVRARPGAPVAVPVDWSDLQHRDFRADAVTLRTASGYFKNKDDPWKEFGRQAVSVAALLRKLEDSKARWPHTKLPHTKVRKRHAGGHSA